MLDIRNILDQFDLWTLSAHCEQARTFAKALFRRQTYRRSIPQSMLDRFADGHAPHCEKCLA